MKKYMNKKTKELFVFDALQKDGKVRLISVDSGKKSIHAVQSFKNNFRLDGDLKEPYQEGKPPRVYNNNVDPATRQLCTKMSRDEFNALPIEENQIKLTAFTGMPIGIYDIAKEDDEAIYVNTNHGLKAFSKVDGKEIGAKRVAYANRVILKEAK